MPTDRKTFLRMIAAAAVLRPAAQPFPQQTATPDPDEQQFAGRVMEDLAAALRCALCNIGDRLGLFKAMAESGPITAAEFARRTCASRRLL